MSNSIVFILGSLGFGGAERVISQLANHYADKQWDVNVVTLLSDEVSYSIDNRVRLTNLSFPDRSRWACLPRWVLGIRKIVKTEHPDVVVSFAARINIISQISCLGLRQDVVVSERNDPRRDGRGPAVRLLTRMLYPRAKKVVFQTKRAQSCFSRRVISNSVIIPNPISISCHRAKKVEKRIVSVGRLAPQKNHKLLINAFKTVQERHPDYTLTIYGEGNLREEIEALIKSYSLCSSVNLPGTIENINEMMSNAEIFVLSSDYEGLSNALLEAMAMGLPCISTDCAGSDEFIQNRVSGILVPCRDAQALAHAIEELIADKQLANRLGATAKANSIRFLAPAVLKQWEECIGLP